MPSLVRKACLDERSTSAEFKESTSEQYDNMYVNLDELYVTMYAFMSKFDLSVLDIFFTLHVNFFQEENVKLSEELQRAVENSANLCEKVIKLDLKCDRLKNRLEDIKKDTG